MNIGEENKKIITETVRLFKPYKRKVVMVITCITLSSWLSILNPIVNQRLMDDGLILQNINVIIKYSFYGLFLMVLIQ